MKVSMEKREKPTEQLIAVYGTLKRGRGNHHLLRDSTFLGEHVTEPKFTMFGKGAGFPIVKTYGETPISIEVFSVTEETKKSVDMLEGFTGIPGDARNWYDQINVETPYGVAGMYVMHTPEESARAKSSIVADGKW